MKWKPRTRVKTITRLQKQSFDILIIGGGATGSGCALDAASRGLNVALIESQDFSSGTSGKSTKLLHGGVRYIEKAIRELDMKQFKLVINALNERYYCLNLASYLTTTVDIMIPIYSIVTLIYYYITLKLYDWLSKWKSIGRSHFISKEESIIHFGSIEKEKLIGSIVYKDGMFDDERMGIMIALTAEFHGAAVINHFTFEDFIKEENRIIGVRCKDELTGYAIKIKCKCVISATGAYADKIRVENDENFENIMAQSSGTHIVLPQKYSPFKMGLVDTRTDDNRMMFMLPWKGNMIVGSTEDDRPLEMNPQPKADEINFLLNETKKYLNIEPIKEEVLSSFCGFRPLIKPPSNVKTESIIRSHKVYVEKDGLITIVGGKWTTFRAMAEEAIDTAINVFSLMPKNECITEAIKLVGSKGYSNTFFHKVADYLKCNMKYAKHLTDLYGSKSFLMKKYLDEHPRKLSKNYSFTEAEIYYVIENEKACTVSDVINGRFRLGFIDVRESMMVFPRVLRIMKDYFDWSEEFVEKQRKDFKKMANTFGLDVLVKKSE